MVLDWRARCLRGNDLSRVSQSVQLRRSGNSGESQAPRANVAATRKAGAKQFHLGPSWLPEYPGYTDPTWGKGYVLPPQQINAAPGLFLVVSLKQDDDEGLFTFNAPPVAHTKPSTEPPEGWQAFWKNVEKESITAVMLSYRGKCKAIGMKELGGALVERPLALSIADTRHYVDISSTGSVSGGGAVIRVRHAPCTGGVDDDKLSIYPSSKIVNPCEFPGKN